MIRNGIFALVVGLLGMGSASADPVGDYTVILGNPGGSATRTGRVRVAKLDESYRVTWNFGGETVTGVALGGAFNRGDLVFGPAHRDDLILVIGFKTDEEFGSSTMVLQIDGTYQGYRVSSRTNKVTPEQWVPAN